MTLPFRYNLITVSKGTAKLVVLDRLLVKNLEIESDTGLVTDGFVTHLINLLKHVLKYGQ